MKYIKFLLISILLLYFTVSSLWVFLMYAQKNPCRFSFLSTWSNCNSTEPILLSERHTFTAEENAVMEKAYQAALEREAKKSTTSPRENSPEMVR